uniref:PXCC family protein n=1 Tax=Scytodes thoracica TaxID=1112478 RepID=A0A0A0VBY2_SCYTH|nr:PXCC family protein [Scytodes thoracica]
MMFRLNEVLVLIACMIFVCSAYIYQGSNDVKGQCEIDGEIYTPGKHQLRGQCARLFCSEVDFEVQGCGMSWGPPECPVVEDLSKDYPSCCPKPICPTA